MAALGGRREAPRPTILRPMSADPWVAQNGASTAGDEGTGTGVVRGSRVLASTATPKYRMTPVESTPTLSSRSRAGVMRRRVSATRRRIRVRAARVSGCSLAPLSRVASGSLAQRFTPDSYASMCTKCAQNLPTRCRTAALSPDRTKQKPQVRGHGMDSAATGGRPSAALKPRGQPHAGSIPAPGAGTAIGWVFARRTIRRWLAATPVRWDNL
jgi:hypothetical protein